MYTRRNVPTEQIALNIRSQGSMGLRNTIKSRTIKISDDFRPSKIKRKKCLLITWNYSRSYKYDVTCCDTKVPVNDLKTKYSQF